MIKRIKNKFWGDTLRRGMIPKINALPIKESGIDGDNDPYVILEDGTTFYGHVSRTYDVTYLHLNSKTKKVLQKECVQVAADIVIRYVEGALMYGGPKKQSRYVVQKGDSVSEMGGYEGFCSIKLAQQVGSEGQVIAIEPMEDNFRLLMKNKKANNLNQLHVVNRAVWDEEKMVDFQRRPGDGQSSSIEMNYDKENSYQVKAEPLDVIYSAFDRKPENFMIVQLNGAEINALRSLTSFSPSNLSIAARYDTENEDAAIAIKRNLESKGYKVEIDEEDFVFATLA
jgi:FkbM family methyltransferase